MAIAASLADDARRQPFWRASRPAGTRDARSHHASKQWETQGPDPKVYSKKWSTPFAPHHDESSQAPWSNGTHRVATSTTPPTPNQPRLRIGTCGQRLNPSTTSCCQRTATIRRRLSRRAATRNKGTQRAPCDSSSFSTSTPSALSGTVSRVVLGAAAVATSQLGRMIEGRMQILRR